MAYNPVDALGAVELPNREFLLIFNTLGVYVDMQGRKSRDKEIMYPALPEKVAICDGKLLVYSDTHIDVFDTQSGDWVQSINIRKTRPLLKSGHLNLSMLQEMPHVTFLSNISRGMYEFFSVNLCNFLNVLPSGPENLKKVQAKKTREIK